MVSRFKEFYLFLIMQGGSDIIALFSDKFASFYFFEQGELLGFFPWFLGEAFCE